MQIEWEAPGRPRRSVDARWLRSLCRCDECGDSAAGLRWLSPSSLREGTAACTPTEVRADASALIVCWADGHESHYDLDSMEAHFATPSAMPLAEVPLPENPLTPLGHDEVLVDDASLFEGLDRLVHQGVVRISGAPRRPAGTAEFAERFGPVRVTSYGAVQEFKTAANPRTAAETGRAQIPHTDEPFRYSPPGFLFFHMAMGAPVGQGSTVLVDGFAAADELRRTHPDSFELLATAPIPLHRRHAGDVHFETRSTVFTVGPDGSLEGVRFNPRCLADLHPLDPNVGQVIEAVARFTEIIEDPAQQRVVHLASGDILAFDNHRILHGRTGFSDEHPRHLLSCNVDRDAVHSSWRVLNGRFGEVAVVLPQGSSV